MTSGSIYFNSLVGIGSNIHVVNLTNLDNSSSSIAMKEWNFSLGRLQCTPRRLHSYNFLPDVINLISEVHKVITAVLLGNAWVDALFFVHLATVSNKYLGLFSI